MAVHISRYNLTYINVPKVACTSIKEFLFEIETGIKFQNFDFNGKHYGIHKFAGADEFSRIPNTKMDGHVKFAVVRDPWSRIFSCYKDKVVEKNELGKIEFTPEQKDFGMVASPSIDNFIDLLPHYRRVSKNISRHSQKLTHFLGNDPSFYDKIFNIKQLPKMVDFVQKIVGDVPQLEHLNKKSLRNALLTEEEIARNKKIVERRYAEDFEVFGDYF